MVRKAKPQKPDKRVTREMYSWHLNDNEFDRTQWWQNLPDAKIDPIAALYELARRHPLIGAGRMGLLDWRKRPWLDPIWYLSVYGLKSWPKLDWRVRACWPKVAGNLKGVDCRDANIQCTSLETEVLTQIKTHRAFTQKKYKRMTLGRVSSLLEKDIITNSPSTKELEAGIKREAVAAYRNGYVLVVVAPDLAVDKAESLMAREYREYQAKHRIRTQRARYKEWLPLISGFENAETGRQKDTSQVFIRYRRAVDGICFT